MRKTIEAPCCGSPRSRRSGARSPGRSSASTGATSFDAPVRVVRLRVRDVRDGRGDDVDRRRGERLVARPRAGAITIAPCGTFVRRSWTSRGESAFGSLRLVGRPVRRSRARRPAARRARPRPRRARGARAPAPGAATSAERERHEPADEREPGRERRAAVRAARSRSRPARGAASTIPATSASGTARARDRASEREPPRERERQRAKPAARRDCESDDGVGEVHEEPRHLASAAGRRATRRARTRPSAAGSRAPASGSRTSAATATAPRAAEHLGREPEVVRRRDARAAPRSGASAARRSPRLGSCETRLVDERPQPEQHERRSGRRSGERDGDARHSRQPEDGDAASGIEQEERVRRVDERERAEDAASAARRGARSPRRKKSAIAAGTSSCRAAVAGSASDAYEPPCPAAKQKSASVRERSTRTPAPREPKTATPASYATTQRERREQRRPRVARRPPGRDRRTTRRARGSRARAGRRSPGAGRRP